MASPAGEPVDFHHQVLRLDFGIGGDGRQGMLGFPGAELRPPGAARRRQAFVMRSGRVSARTVFKAAENALHVAHDGHIGNAVLADFRGIDIHVNHLGVGRESRQPSGDAVVEAHAQRHQHIAMSQPHVGGVTAVHAGHADEIGMRRGQSAQAHQGGDSGRIVISTNSRNRRRRWR
jgi:hypothetical protein